MLNKLNFIIIILTIGLSNTYNTHIYMDRFLFCLDHKIDPISILNENKKNTTGINDLDNWILKNNVIKLEQWIPIALKEDNSGDIYLNRIYRIYIENTDLDKIDLLRVELEKFSFIHSSTYEFKRKIFHTPNDPMYSNQWFLNQINTPQAWDFWSIPSGNHPNNDNILLASVDTGVDWDHPDLINNIWQNLGEDADGDGHTIEYISGNWVLDPGDLNEIDDDNWDGNPASLIDDLIGWDFSGWSGEEDNNPIPKSGVSPYSTWSHGTHVAGILGATTDNGVGIASTTYNGNVLCIKVSREQQTGTPYITEGYSGILYAAQLGFFNGGFTIINNSWGGIGYNAYEQSVIDIAHNDYNAIIFSAAGNGEESGGELEGTLYPASYNNNISVTALGTNDQWNHWANYHQSVDLAAPGEGIRSTIVGGYSSWSGTSMATPVAASCAGLLGFYHNEWSSEKIATMIVATANPIIYEINNEEYLQGKLGSGRVDILQALSTDLYPNLSISGYDLALINDNNETLDPGDSADLFVIIYNQEDWGEAININGTLTSLSDDILIINGESEFFNLLPGEAGLNFLSPFTFQLDSSFEDDSVRFLIDFVSNVDGNSSYNGGLYLSLPIFNNILIGDMNEDEHLNLLDVIIYINIILETIEPTNFQLSIGDFNDDGALDLFDILILVNTILER